MLIFDFVGVLRGFRGLRKIQDDGKGGLSLRGAAFMTVLAVLTVLETQWRAPCPPFAGPTKYRTKRQRF